MGVRSLTQKDLLLLTRDRRALVILLVMPLVFIAILGFSAGRMLGWREENTILRLVWADESPGEWVQGIVEALEQRGGIEVEFLHGAEPARREVDAGTRTAAVIVGPSFQARVAELELRDLLNFKQGKLSQGLRSLDIAVYTRPAHAATGAVVDQLVFSETVRSLLPRLAGKDPLVRGYLGAQPANEVRSGPAGETANPAEEKTDSPRVGSPPGPDYTNVVYQVLVPSYTVMFTFLLINIMARSFIGEREHGTLRRLRAAPLGPLTLLVGKTLPFLLISLTQGMLLFFFGRILFGMSWGPHPWMLLPVLASTSLSATGLGLLTAVLVRTDAQVSAYGNLLVITLAGISGCFMPRDWLPDLMRQISLGTPHAWALIAYDQVLNSASPNAARVMLCCTVLAGFSGAFFLLGWWRFRTVG